MHSFATALLVLGFASNGILSAGIVPEWSAGPSVCRLRPHSGQTQELKGFCIGGRALLDSHWSIELGAIRENGRDERSVELRQWRFQAGPRYSLALGDRWDAFAHLLVGKGQLKATLGALHDTRDSAVLTPGLGVDYRLTEHWRLRAQADAVVTRYAGEDQRSGAFSLGVAYQ